MGVNLTLFGDRIKQLRENAGMTQAENYTYSQIACALGVHTELAMIKAQLLNSRGHKLNIPYIPRSNFLEKI